MILTTFDTLSRYHRYTRARVTPISSKAVRGCQESSTGLA